MSFQPSPDTGTGTSNREPSPWGYPCGGSLRGHLQVNLAVLALLVAIWALTGAGYFWPAWAALGMAAGLALKAFFFRRHRRPRSVNSASDST